MPRIFHLHVFLALKLNKNTAKIKKKIFWQNVRYLENFKTKKENLQNWFFKILELIF